MKSNCFNYIKFYDGAVNEIIDKYFNLPENLMKFKEDEQGYIGGHRFDAEAGEVTFISSGGPPIMLYAEWMNKFRGLEMEYEFHQSGVGVCGYGLIASKMHSHTAITYSTRNQYTLSKVARDWTYPLWDPIYEKDEDDSKEKIEDGMIELGRIIQAKLKCV
jgi:hypothetical protein